MPDPTLQAAALRYAAGDLTPTEAAAFETRLADDQDARDALAEAVRLSARALGQTPPAPDRTFRSAIRERLSGCPAWLARRAYRGHPAAWAALGAVAVAACTVVGLALAEREPVGESVAAVGAPSASASLAMNPRPAEPGTADSRDADPEGLDECGLESSRSVAEVWADLSTPDHVEKAHDDEQRWRDRLRGLGALQPVRATSPDDPRSP